MNRPISWCCGLCSGCSVDVTWLSVHAVRPN